MPTHITSLQNPQIKEVLKLEKRSVREQARQFVVEGVREVRRAMEAGFVPVHAFVCPELAKAEELQPALHQLEQFARTGKTRFFTVTPEVFAKLTMREGSGGVLLVLPFLHTALDDLPLPEGPFLAVIENAEKPGNLGAILRTADAAGVDGVIACGTAGGTDLHNPNVVRASLGTLFTVPVAEASTAETIGWLRKHGIQIVAATPEGAARYTDADLQGPLALVLGSEAHGLTPAWLDAADVRVFIPMHGQADSLNLAASTAILLYEAVRQRASTHA
jgi:RNA methyltransferase, TrmH family